MYNLNVSLAPTPLLSVDSGGVCSTPRTPEILNSLMAMTHPLEYGYTSNSQLSQPDSPSSCSAVSPLDSPAGNSGPPSVQQMCSQLIKASLKQSIQSKRKLSSGDSSGNETCSKFSRRDCETTDDESITGKSPKNGVRTLTPEDEDRRRRRRERNKIAATKCRMKKREKTMNLVQESETLENQNVTLKKEVTDLETQRQKLVQILEAHNSKCIHPNGYQSPQYASQSPAYKYLPELGLCPNNKVNINNNSSNNNHNNNNNNNNNNSNNNNINNHDTLKFCQTRKQQPPNSINLCKTLPPGYCKPSPTADINYTLSPDNTDLVNGFHSNFKTDYIPYSENSTNDVLLCCDPGNDFINLKTELNDSTSPYTTVQSADRFLFESTDTYLDNDRLQTHHTNGGAPLINIKDNRNTPILEFNGNIQSFDAKSIIHATDFLDGNDTQFTDLDSGMTTYANIQSNGGCLV